MHSRRQRTRFTVAASLSLLLLSAALLAQAPVFERATPKAAASSASEAPKVVAWTQDNRAFPTDDFRVGKKGETWLVDTIRTWVVADANLDATGVLGDLYSKVTLYGGIADPDFSKEAAPPVCDCEGVMAIKSVELDKHSTVSSGDLKITPVQAAATAGALHGKRIFQVDFTNLQWSVPGGSDLQFGIYAVSRSAAPGGLRTWSSYAQTGEPFHIRVFSGKGKLIPATKPNNSPLRIRVQVWAHASTARSH